MQYVPIGTFSPLFSQFREEMNACYRSIYRNGSKKRRTAANSPIRVRTGVCFMHNHWIHSTRLAALSLALLLSSCGGALAQADASPAAYTQSGAQGVSLTWTIENLCFDGQLLALDVRTTPSDTRYAACNDVLGDYEDFTQADDVRANGLIPLGYYCEADVETDSPADPILSIGSGWRDGSSAVQQIRWLLAPDEAARARSIHLFCGIMETPGQLATEDLYVLDIPAPNATTVAHVSVNTEQVKTDRIREVLLTQIGATTMQSTFGEIIGPPAESE